MLAVEVEYLGSPGRYMLSTVHRDISCGMGAAKPSVKAKRTGTSSHMPTAMADEASLNRAMQVMWRHGASGPFAGHDAIGSEPFFFFFCLLTQPLSSLHQRLVFVPRWLRFWFLAAATC